MDYTGRKKKIKEKMKDRKVEAFLTFFPPHLKYLTGYEGEGYLLLTPSQDFLFLDARYLHEVKDTLKEAKIVEIKRDFFSLFRGILNREGIYSVAVESNRIPFSFLKELRKSPRKRFIPVEGWIEEERMIKEEEEIEKISHSILIARQVLKEIEDFLQEGREEREVMVEVEYRLRKKGSEPLPFLPIVASGENSAFPHTFAKRKTLKEKEPIIIDLGARFQGYASDLTRTFFLKGKGEWEEIEELVKRALEIALQNIRPGIKASSLYKIVYDFFRSEGKEDNFLHGLGHGVGLEVHEKPSLSWKGEEVLKEGMVFTLEPGLYFPEGKIRGGIRIEEMVYMGKNGVRVISQEEENGKSGSNCQ